MQGDQRNILIAVTLAALLMGGTAAMGDYVTRAPVEPETMAAAQTLQPQQFRRMAAVQQDCDDSNIGGILAAQRCSPHRR
jgi:hypothetical protein